SRVCAVASCCDCDEASLPCCRLNRFSAAMDGEPVFLVAIERIAPTIDEHKKGASKTTRPLFKSARSPSQILSTNFAAVVPVRDHGRVVRYAATVLEPRASTS